MFVNGVEMSSTDSQKENWIVEETGFVKVRVDNEILAQCKGKGQPPN